MTKREKFINWMDTHPERMAEIWLVAIEDEGMTEPEFQAHLLDLGNYLARIEKTKKTYKKWDQFILRNMPSKKRRKYGKKRPRPSRFGDTGRTQGLPKAEEN